MKILILGGYGVFGGRLIHLLSDMDSLEIIVTGRSKDKAEAFCRTTTSTATLIPIGLDREDILTGLNKYRPDILVDASGPFQNYGNDPYHVIKACLKAGVHYMDFADAADFVFGVSAFDEQARKAGLVILSGVSSFPVLTAAVVSEFQKSMKVQSVRGGIAPSPYAGIGLNVMKAVVGYAGGPVKLKRGGQEIEAKGLTESMRYTIAPPGFLPLRNIHFSLVDVPDLQVIPAENPSITDIWMGAGPVPESLHRILNVLAKTRALFRLPSFSVFSPLFFRVLNLMKFGEHRGGMFVEAEGISKGKPVKKSWHLLAEGDDGPLIPSMAIEGLIRMWCVGDKPKNGARAATNALSLADYDQLFKSKTIYAGIRDDSDEHLCLYPQILGAAYKGLPKQVRRLHEREGASVWKGNGSVIRGKGILARLIARVFSFPQETDAIPVTVSFSANEKGEIWERSFGGKKFSSFQARGTGRNARLLTERFGVIKVTLALVVEKNQLYLIPRRWSVFGIPLPKRLLPTGKSFEHEVDGVFNFNVRIEAPIVGLIVAYQGWLKPDGD